MTFERAAHLLAPLGSERASSLVHNQATVPFGLAAALLMRTLARVGELTGDVKQTRQTWHAAKIDLAALLPRQQQVQHATPLAAAYALLLAAELVSLAPDVCVRARIVERLAAPPASSTWLAEL
jgi:hypothetical protein